MQKQKSSKTVKQLISILLAMTMFLSSFMGINGFTVLAANDKQEYVNVSKDQAPVDDHNTAQEESITEDTQLGTCDGPMLYAAVPTAETGITRIQWLTDLTTAFGMTVEEDNYPDNYFSDIDSTNVHYYEIMLATEFGLVDVEAGDPLRPDDPATREFVAHTLNLCMGYVPDEGTSYTFSEANTVNPRE